MKTAPMAGPGRGVAMRDALTHRWPEDLMEAGGLVVTSVTIEAPSPG